MEAKINKKENFLWIDYAKFIGIFLMIFQHNISQLYHLGTNFIFNSIGAFILLFHMPLFFIISGFLYHDKGKLGNYKKMLWTLFIPYVLYQFLYLPFVLINKVFIHNMDFFIVLKKCLLGILYGETILNSSYITVCGPCWFIFSMFSIRLLINIFKFNYKASFILATSSFILLNCLIYYNINIYFCIAPTLLAIPYFVFGYCLQHNNKILKFLEFNTLKRKLLQTFLLFIIFIYLVWVLLYTNHTLRIPSVMELAPSLLNLILYYIAGLLGSIAIISVSKMFKQTTLFVDIISKNTLFIIFFHFVLLAFGKFFNFNKFIVGQNTITIFLIVSLSTIANLLICYLVIKLLEKSSPLLLGKFKGKGVIS